MEFFWKNITKNDLWNEVYFLMTEVYIFVLDVYILLSDFISWWREHLFCRRGAISFVQICISFVRKCIFFNQISIFSIQICISFSRKCIFSVQICISFSRIWQLIMEVMVKIYLKNYFRLKPLEMPFPKLRLHTSTEERV